MKPERRRTCGGTLDYDARIVGLMRAWIVAADRVRQGCGKRGGNRSVGDGQGRVESAAGGCLDREIRSLLTLSEQRKDQEGRDAEHNLGTIGRIAGFLYRAVAVPQMPDVGGAGEVDGMLDQNADVVGAVLGPGGFYFA
jgi:hypothetical protein